MSHRIEIVEHDARWADEFAALASELRAALGALALAVDHIGSTSVPGLAAKDVIDLQVTVAALGDDVARAMTAAGFTHRADVTCDHVPAGADPVPHDWAKLYFQAKPGALRAHIHVRVLGAQNQRYALLFRDYLRAHPEAAAALAEIKRQLAARFPDDADSYYAIKDPVCDVIWYAAREWDAHGRT
ncbi:MAG: GrpB family protein [Candidatus Eisenbacteria bacterium]|uniref:GrpB family protein n=1 Tax=Eiseniibacteriota bacterium TaxID=2212470 RepID=A0A933SFH6_UNCEI|nr:GrpB family protein [Candidatus Eisenbacteria bacterium]